jgi:uncharacterized membrane protein
VKDAVAVYRAGAGMLRVDDSVRPTTQEEAGWGALLGALLGAIVVAPATAGASAVVAATSIGAAAASLGLVGGVVSADQAARWKKATGVSDEFVGEIGAMLRPGQSALFVLADAADPAMVAEQFRGYGGKVLRTTLPPEAAAKFQQLMTPVTPAAR